MSKSQRSVMSHQFSQVPSVSVPRSSFDRSHGLKTTFNAGTLIPIYVDEVLPGDTFNLSMTGFARLATPIKPIMDNMFMETFFFFVPNRLLWENWHKFNGAQDNPTDSTDFVMPQMPMSDPTGFKYSSLADYFGLPTETGTFSVSSLPFRAYNRIWNEWFRDQNLQPSVYQRTQDTDDDMTEYKVLRRGKRHDYFTSALPWPQKGEPVTIPLGGFAPVERVTTTSQPTFYNSAGGGSSVPLSTKDNAGDVYHQKSDEDNAIGALRWGSAIGLQANLGEATQITINLLREGFQLQRMFERDARGGTRLTEIIRSHFGVISPDARLQRPEYLGGGSSPINITPIAQTSNTQTEANITVQGNLAAMGTVTLNNHGFTKSFTEHGIIIGLVNVRADLTYQQGVNRMWSRKTRFDHYWPALSRLGEQEILNQEIFLTGGGAAKDTEVFGYQERYAEYRYKPSLITGKFRSKDATSLDVWHLSQHWEQAPELNANFIEDNPPLERAIAVKTEPHFLFDAYFKLRCARPMPLYGVPGMIDHF